MRSPQTGIFGEFFHTGFSMRRTSMMTLGFVLIFLGAQLALVDSYLLTPRISNFLSQQEEVSEFGGNSVVPNQPQASPFRNASFPNPSFPNNVNYLGIAPQKRVTPPKWLCWPVLFCGTVVLLQGISMNRD